MALIIKPCIWHGEYLHGLSPKDILIVLYALSCDRATMTQPFYFPVKETSKATKLTETKIRTAIDRVFPLLDWEWSRSALDIDSIWTKRVTVNRDR